MDKAFFDGMREITADAYENNHYPDVFYDFTEWWEYNSIEIREAIRRCAFTGIRVAEYKLPSHWFYNLAKYKTLLQVVLSDAESIEVDFVSRGIHNDITLAIRW
jgi:hypothetical protein